MAVAVFRNEQEPEATGGIRLYRDKLPGGGEGYRAEAPAEGGRIVFRGEAGFVGGADWSRYDYLTVPTYFEANHSLFMHLRFWEDAPYSDEECADIAMGVMPGLEVPVVFPLGNLNLGVLYLPRTPGRLKNVSVGKPKRKERIGCLALEIPASAGPQTIWFGIPVLSDRMPEFPTSERKLVDELGQWAGKTWSGKTSGEAVLIGRLRELADASEEPPALPEDTDRYGGWKGKSFEATGYFRREHDGERWWLVTPEGNSFFSTGLNCVRPHVSGPIDGMEMLYEWIPPEEGAFADAWIPVYGDGPKELCYSTANLIRAFGDDWYAQWLKMTGSRLREWGINTVANWSDEGVGARMQIPYVIEMEFPDTERKVFRDFPDVFSQEYADAAEHCAMSLAPTADDPYLIGYFMRNEPEWGFGDYNIAEMLLACSSEFESKRRLVSYLAEQYEDKIARLNEAWQLSLESFDELLAPLELAVKTESANDDLRAFTKALIAEYIRVPALAARKVDAHHLNLGLRWAWVASDLFYAGSEYIDVFSLNCYKLNPEPHDISAAAEKSGCPVMIGEFHAGALDVGLPATGLRAVASQAERGAFYQWYVEQGAALPELVGVHYFTLGDQPVLGRFDGENCNIGFVDICQRPYEEMIDKVAETNRRVCRIHGGELPPTSARPVEVPREGF